MAYPAAMAESGVAGTVVLQAIVDTSGRVVPSSIEVLSASNGAFEAPAVAMLRDTRFVPGRIGDWPAAILIQLPIAFEMVRTEGVSAEDSAAAVERARQGELLAKNGRLLEAMAALGRAQVLDHRLGWAASFWHPLCWYGALWRQPVDVMWACDQLVTLARDEGWARDARGIARAMAGQTEGAIADLSAFAAQTSREEERRERLGWIAALREGRNPFTEELCAELRRRGPSHLN